MHVWNGLDSITRPLPASSVAVGTFDGVHVGHQALIATAISDARGSDRVAVAFTFDRHPSTLVDPEHVPGLLTTPEQRRAAIEGLGADHLVVARFNQELRDMPPDRFVRDILVELLGARTVCVGAGFRFGRDRAGDEQCLREMGERLGFHVRVLAEVRLDGERVSSSGIRRLLDAGDVRRAAQWLGRPYALVGLVVEGEKLGRKLGYPTANIRPTHQQAVPRDGVYAVWVRVDGELHPGACSIGMRPTVGGRSRTIEAYLLDWSGSLYGCEVELVFESRLRDELAFPDLDSLVAQMDKDVEEVRRRLV